MTWGRTYLWIAILIFAAAASVVARLVEIGEANLIDGRNPISFCNLLFAGNLVAALTLFALYHREWSPAHLRALSRRQWLVQTALALTSGAIAPAMMFTAIAHTSVTNIVLIETIEIPLVLLLAWLLYREKSNWTAVLGALCALGGVATTLILQMDASPESMAAARMQGGVGYGEFFAAAATVLLVCGAEIGRKQLQTIPLGIF
ncbi:MAG: EamA family transporter, partial [Gemmatimonadetes bacterium]|nr:EamA family transporter [Gemmatimonadota bacterium]